MAWILYGLAGFIFFAAVVTAVVLLLLKKKFVVVVLVFIPLLFISCGLGGAATWKLFADIEEIEPGPGPVVVNTATDTAVSADVATSTSGAKTQKATSDTTLLNEDYGFLVDVGAEHVDDFLIQPIDPEGFSEASYMYCCKTAEEWEDTFYCPYGYAPSFSISVMTKKQWDEASASPMSVYILLDKAGNRYFAFSHPNGLLPGDVPASEGFYEQVRQSFEFIP